ncbi:MAG: sigma-70 family RNA polymerase sigma factor [Bryobacterales bacterium]|nr:sigma-70 family RNA polymerase sigma factor [Bryobacterales bacterium]
MDSANRSSVQLTRLLQAWNRGDQDALQRLSEIVYAELRRLASYNLRGERQGHLLQPSALVNEAFLRLMSGAAVDWQNRAHFYGVAARLMRQILVDFARARATVKRGQGDLPLALSAVDLAAEAADSVDLLDVDAALQELAQLHPRQANVVELRFFAGLENREVAACLGISDDTVLRDWRMARAWLFARLHA